MVEVSFRTSEHKHLLNIDKNTEFNDYCHTNTRYTSWEYTYKKNHSYTDTTNDLT